ncbi:MAG: Calx-beta domain-containing protein [Pyrinomonadaceae bacterium]
MSKHEDALKTSTTDAATTQNTVYSESGLIGAWYLSFPLRNQNSATAAINSIFDHSRTSAYTADNKTVAYTGETGINTYGESYVLTNASGTRLYGFAQDYAHTPFTINGNYTGGGDTHYLYYDGHPGFDYRASEGTDILAPADGRLYIPTSDSVNGNPSTFNTFVIDHGNGYSTWILHAQSGSIISPRDVTRGEVVAKVGHTGTGVAHLHFEVRHNNVSVDPYGWTGGCRDPYTVAVNTNLWTNSGVQWNFDIIGNTQGWSPLNVECFSVGNGNFAIDPAALDPYVQSPPLVNVNATSFNAIEFRMASNAPDGNGTIYFTTANSPSWGEDKKVNFTVTNNGNFLDYHVGMGSHSLWVGQITGIRIDPANSGRSGTSSDTIAFSYIRLTSGGNSCSFTTGQGTSGSELTAFQSAFNNAGGQTALGCPVNAVGFDGYTSFAGTSSHYQTFANGSIQYLVSGSRAGQSFAIVSPLYSKWASLGFTANNPLGYPINTLSAQGTSCYGTNDKYQSFEGGSLNYLLSGTRTGSVYEVHGAIHRKWEQKGFAICPMGVPISDESDAQPSGATGLAGRLNQFEGGQIYWIKNAPAGNSQPAYEVHGTIYTTYVGMGGSAGWLGFPTSDEYIASSGYARNDFEGGYITTTDGVNYQAFRYGSTECASVSGISPTNGSVGSNVVIAGNNFSGVTNVNFSNNVPAQFVVNSARQITATVPNGATTGPITLAQIRCSDAQSGTFTVTAASSTPNPPTLNPTANITQGGAMLSWSGVSGATDYRVQVSTSSTFNTSTDGRDCFNCVAGGNQVVSAPSTTYSLSGLAAGTVYYWRVRAGRFVTTSEWITNWSSTGRFTTTTTTPTPPTPSPSPTPAPSPFATPTPPPSATPTPTPNPVPPTGSSVQFSSTTYSVNEGAGFATITVNRSGGTSGSVTVDYAAGDGTAKQRTDYTIASGTLNFAAGESSKTFTVLIMDNARVDGDRTVNLTLSNPVSATLGALKSAVLTISDNDTATATTNPIDGAQFFVREHYLDFLNRLPDDGGLSYWSNGLISCNGDPQCLNSRRVSVSAAFFVELEFQDTGGYVYRLYKATYGERPSYAQFMPDRSRVVGGANLEAGKQAFADTWVARPEFLTKYPAAMSPGDFVDRLIATVKTATGNVVDLSGQRASYMATLQANGRGSVVRQIAEDPAFRQAEYNRAFVLMQYFGYLRRDPETDGYNFWLDVLNNRVANNYRGMVCAFITSAEYQDRFSSVRTRNDSICGQLAP